jgi:hypothetical protein
VRECVKPPHGFTRPRQWTSGDLSRSHSSPTNDHDEHPLSWSRGTGEIPPNYENYVRRHGHPPHEARGRIISKFSILEGCDLILDLIGFLAIKNILVLRESSHNKTHINSSSAPLFASLNFPSSHSIQHQSCNSCDFLRQLQYPRILASFLSQSLRPLHNSAKTMPPSVGSNGSNGYQHVANTAPFNNNPYDKSPSSLPRD